ELGREEVAGRVGGIEVAQRPRRIGGAVGVRQTYFAEVLVARDARVEVAARPKRIEGWSARVGAIRVRAALETIAEVAAEVAEIGAGQAHPAGRSRPPVGSGIGCAWQRAEDVACVGGDRRGAGGAARAAPS